MTRDLRPQQVSGDHLLQAHDDTVHMSKLCLVRIEAHKQLTSQLFESCDGRGQTSQDSLRSHGEMSTLLELNHDDVAGPSIGILSPSQLVFPREEQKLPYKVLLYVKEVTDAAMRALVSWTSVEIGVPLLG